MSIQPYNQLKIFISSAMSPEDDIDWINIRQNVKNAINEYPYFNAFTIEDYSTSIPSSGYFQWQISEAHAVVLLIASEIREGTKKEIAIVKSKKIPLFLYFIQNEHTSESVYEFKSWVEENDYCTYKNISDCNGIGHLVCDDIFQTLIAHFMFKNVYDNKSTDSRQMFQIAADNENYGLNKESVSLFSCCHEFLTDLIGRPVYSKIDDNTYEKSKVYDLGCKILNWLFSGNEFLTSDDINLLVDTVNVYQCKDCLPNRWKAIQSYLKNDYEASKDFIKQAQDSFKSTEIPEWLKNDLLIDLRSIDIAIFNSKSNYSFEVQNKINASSTFVHLPITDRFKSNVLERIIDHYFKIDTIDKNSVLLGTDFTEALKSFENYLFSAILYGSLTHLILARKLLIKLLYSYGKLHSDEKLLLSAIKLSVINCDYKEFNKIVDNYFDTIYEELLIEINTIWNSTYKLEYLNPLRTQMNLILFSKFGLYFNDDTFERATRYLIDLSESIYWGNSEDFYSAILTGQCRFNNRDTIIMITNVINNIGIHLGGTLSRIIGRLNIDGVDANSLQKLHDSLEKILKEKSGTFLQRGGNIQDLSNLINQNENLFSNLIDTSSIQKSELEILNLNLGKDCNYAKIVDEKITLARTQFNHNNNGKVFSLPSENPYGFIEYIIEQYLDDDVKTVLDEKFFDLSFEVLNSQVPLSIKYFCISGLNSVISVYRTKGYEIPKNIIILSNEISSIDVNNHMISMPYATKSNYKMQIILLKFLCGQEVKKDFMITTLSIANKNPQEREILINCILIYLKFNNDLKELFLSLAVLLSADEDRDVRRESIELLFYYLNTEYKELAKEKLYVLSTDSDISVKRRLIWHIYQNKLLDEKFRDELIDTLKNDSNYLIRQETDKITKELLYCKNFKDNNST